MVKAYAYAYFYKLIKTQKSLYIFNLIPPKLNSLRHPNTYSVMRCRDDYFKNCFIPYVVREWNRLSTEVSNSTSCQNLRSHFIFHYTNLLFTVFYSSPYCCQIISQFEVWFQPFAWT